MAGDGMTMFLAGITATFGFSALVFLFLFLAWRAPLLKPDGTFAQRPTRSRVSRRHQRSTAANA